MFCSSPAFCWHPPNTLTPGRFDVTVATDYFREILGFSELTLLFLVCKATVHEMEDEIAKVDPKKVASVGGFRLDEHGNAVSKRVKLAKSEMYLTELMENICKYLKGFRSWS